MVRKYEWRDSISRLLKNRDPQAMGEELERISQQAEVMGQRLDKAIVSDAARLASPLNPLFVWDDAKAAQLYREGQARALAGGLVVKGDPDAN